MGCGLQIFQPHGYLSTMLFKTLYHKMAAILFAVVFLCGVAFYLVLAYTAGKYQQEVTQKLNTGLAQHIVDEEAWLAGEKVNHKALKKLFHNLMVINPEIEVYLLNKEGRILDYAAPSGKVKRLSVDVGPIKEYLSGDMTYPFTGDDPRSLQRHKVFSVAEINGTQGPAGYVYVILGGELFDGINDRVKDSYILKYAMFLLIAALLVALLAGLGSFSYVTRRLRKLTGIMQDFSRHPDSSAARFAVVDGSEDEINLLGASFNEMADRIDQQVESLKQNDAQRRELIANVSHDLRTPLTSLHGYLETLLLKDNTLSDEEKHQYLEIANARSKQLNELIGELFELAKLDSCTTLMNVEAFSL
ncbi:MAG TPA: HAMP domain-containing protein, partial [Gammaproteobacteria bacterium]|nr:HAMP domain-containing protein [Gammaproteobacteria bacterium]